MRADAMQHLLKWSFWDVGMEITIRNVIDVQRKTIIDTSKYK